MKEALTQLNKSIDDTSLTLAGAKEELGRAEHEADKCRAIVNRLQDTLDDYCGARDLIATKVVSAPSQTK